ncbi:hypothetical protein QTP86_028274 [Hemibagrus guttatus]|nr:hypothetical protein QTP86_028274 [Hemibagrus guttatus]
MSDVGSVMSDVGSVISDVGSVISDVGSVMSDVGSVISDVGSVMSDVGSVISDVGSLMSDVGSVMSDVGSVISDVGSVISDVGSVMSDVGSVMSDVGSVISDVGSVMSDVGSVMSDVGSVMSDVGSVISDVGSVMSDVGSVMSDVGSVMSDVGSVMSDVGSVMSDVGSVMSDVGSVMSDVGSVISDVGSVMSDVGSVMSDVDVHLKSETLVERGVQSLSVDFSLKLLLLVWEETELHVSDPLQASLSVVGALECVVRRCVGPSGGTVIFTKDTGQTLITKHGHHVLTALHLEHPVARTVLECVCSHDGVTADGSKSFILLLAALLRGICDSVHNSTHTHRRHASLKLANQLHAFCWGGLDDVIAHGVGPYASCLFGSGRCEPKGGVLAALVGGFVGGRVSPGQVEVLTPLLCELCTRVGQGDMDSTAIAFIHSNFSGLHTAVSGLHSTQSRVVEGLLLPCDWSVWTEMHGPVKALVVVERLDSHCDEHVNVQFEEHWTVRSDAVIQDRLAAILRLRVGVLLSVVKQPDCVLEWAWLNGVSVLECCDPVQLELLCELNAAQTLPVQPLMRVGMLTHCCRFQLGGRRYTNIRVTHTSLHTHTLVLCAPAAGPLEQSVSVSRGVFSMLQHLNQSHRHNNVSPRPHEQSLTSTLSLRSTPSLTSTPSLRSTPSLTPTQSLMPTQLYSSCPNLCQCILNVGDVIPVGGAFEFLFHHYLLHSNHGDPESRRILAEAVLSVPRSLHSHRPGDFLHHFVHFQNNLLQHRPIREQGPGSEFTWFWGADASGRVCVEPVCSKHQLVASVLQCVNRLLRVEAVIHTARSLTLAASPGPHRDEEEDDDDDEDGT